MTAKDKKNICKKMKVVKKIRDMKNSENSKYEKDNWLTSNKEKLNLFKVQFIYSMVVLIMTNTHSNQTNVT